MGERAIDDPGERPLGLDLGGDERAGGELRGRLVGREPRGIDAGVDARVQQRLPPRLVAEGHEPRERSAQARRHRGRQGERAIDGVVRKRARQPDRAPERGEQRLPPVQREGARELERNRDGGHGRREAWWLRVGEGRGLSGGAAVPAVRRGARERRLPRPAGWSRRPRGCLAPLAPRLWLLALSAGRGSAHVSSAIEPRPNLCQRADVTRRAPRSALPFFLVSLLRAVTLQTAGWCGVG